MEQEIKQSTDLLQLVAWAHANRKMLIGISAIIAIIGAGIGLYVWNKNNHETQANYALSNINPPMREEATKASAADPYLKVAAEFKGTSAGARAQLIAGGILFDAGKYQDARRQFEQFLTDYPEHPLTEQAVLGVASCYEAEGNLAEAATRYKEFVDHHSTSPLLAQAKASLARVYVAQGKPELALQQYDELERSPNAGRDSWSAEAGMQKQELLTKYPNLKKQAPAPTMNVAPGATAAPTLNVTPAAPKAAAPTATNTPAPAAPAKH